MIRDSDFPRRQEGTRESGPLNPALFRKSAQISLHNLTGLDQENQPSFIVVS